MKISVAVDSPLRTDFTYLSKDESISIGDLVEVPFGRRKVFGCVTELDVKSDDKYELKEIGKSLSKSLSLTTSQLRLFRWMSRYYHYPLGKLIFDSLPPLMKRPRPFIPTLSSEVVPLPSLSLDQLNITKKILENFQTFSSQLIHGVTGSGKTLIYLHLIEEALRLNKSVLFLMPEINLTPQFLKVFERHLKVPLIRYNSAITDSEKHGAWQFVKEQSPVVVIGVRSSIFMPIKDLGLIIVDEEHDGSFKQEDRCTYHVRDLAHQMAVQQDIPIVFGSATPSLESYKFFKNSEKNSHRYFPLTKRFGTSHLPKIHFVDLKERVWNEDLWPLLPSDLEVLNEAFNKNEQAIVFVNRLGYAQFLQCRSCGHRFMCPNCAVTLRFFKEKNKMSCHLCGHEAPKVSSCPECQNMSLLQKGFGTERIKEVLLTAFPNRVIERFDRDEITTFDDLKDRLALFEEGKIDLLVGTQMLSKGHNFEKVNTIIILGTDGQLNFPDFRSTERVYQLLTQVGGRAGRFGKESHVYIHTMLPDHPLFTHIGVHAFDDFYLDELRMREMTNYPPYSRIVALYFVGNNRERVKKSSEDAKLLGEKICSQLKIEIELLGPRAAVIEKRVNKFTWGLVMRANDAVSLQKIVTVLLDHLHLPSGVSARVDVDPQIIL